MAEFQYSGERIVKEGDVILTRRIDIIEAFKAICNRFHFNGVDCQRLYKGLMEASQKTAEMMNQEAGEWIKEPDFRTNHWCWHCSKCGYIIGLLKMDANYCPRCGVRMRKETEDAEIC